MQPKRIIPCLDVRDGRVVKGTQFENIRDAGDPVELAALYDREGADEVVLFDITASAEGRKTIIDVARRTAAELSIPFTVGGGISSVKDMGALFEAGADKVSINTAAVKNPDLIDAGAAEFGRHRIVLSVDCKRRENPDQSVWWEVVIHGGRTSTGMNVINWVDECVQRGAGELVLNSIDADGTKDGYDNELNRTIAERVDVPVVASGGAGTLQHLIDAVVDGKVDAVLAASIFHFREIAISEVKQAFQAVGIPVRMG